MMNLMLSRRVFTLLLFVYFGSIAAQNACPPGSGITFDTCEPCPPGSASQDSTFCPSCFAGTFQPLAGQTSCVPCPEGTRSTFGATMCGDCPEGQGLLPNGTCIVCQPGEELLPFSLECLSCTPGFFKAEEGPGPCLPCPPDSFSLSAATECIFCPENQAPVMRNGSCGQCAPGSFFDEFFFSCTQCFSGTFMNVSNVMSDCFPCGGNSFASSGATECIPCPIGQVYINGTKSCEDDCEPGFAYNEFNLECEPCGFNQFSSGGGQRFCDFCREGSFARMMSSTCFLCPFGESFIADIDGCGVCPEGEPYDFSNAKCGLEPFTLSTPLPEAGEA